MSLLTTFSVNRSVACFLLVKPSVVLALFFSSMNLQAQQEVLIPRSVAGDKGKYYLLEAKRNGDVVKALHKRIGPSGVGYTKTETNCKTMLMREIGYSEESPEKIQEKPTQWFELVAGSSKSDLANFICKR